MAVRPEIFIALVAGLGADLKLVKGQISAQLNSAGYTPQIVKMSSLIAECCIIKTDGLAEETRVDALMDAGDDVRRAAKVGDALVRLAAAMVRIKRKEITGDENKPAENTAFIIDSLKNPAEVEALRRIYGANLFIVSVYSRRSLRLEKIANRIARGHNTSVRAEHKLEAARLLDKDEKRDYDKLTQNVQGTFPLGDYFLSLDGAIEKELRRFIDLILGEPFGTPTNSEYYMYSADGAAMRSADLSRQVGAVIVDPLGAQVSSGSNEVPYPGGGFYSEGGAATSDNRDFKREHDPNSYARTDLIREFIRALRTGNLLSAHAHNDDDEVTKQLLYGDGKKYLDGSRVTSLIEFGTVVHAEMHAITEASKFGRSVRDATLYCTVFPCHMCARHIISSGIKTVVYIEPYPKSLTREMYSKEICVDGEGGSIQGSVNFIPFTGIAPRLYARVFRFRRRKDEYGNAIEWDCKLGSPLGASEGQSYLDLEMRYSAEAEATSSAYQAFKNSKSLVLI